MAVIVFCSSLILSAVLTAFIRNWASSVGFVCRPVRERFHQTTVPLGGGIAIFLTLSAFIISAIILVKYFVWPGRFDWLGESVTIHALGFLSKINQLIVILIAGAALFVLGLIDDSKNLGPVVKLVVQFSAAIVAAVFADVRVEFFIESRILTTALSVIWIVLIINAFNFLDNMDGAAAGIAVMTTVVLLVAAVASGQVFVSGLAIIFIGTLLGFLVFNFPPAKIFMGDAGSMVIGFFVAFLTLRTTYYHEAHSGLWYPVFLPVVAMAVPLYDFISVMVLRLMQGKSPFLGDTQHFSHRLKRHGLTDTQAVLTLYLATLCTGLGATFLYQINFFGAVLIFAQTFMVLAIIAIFESTVANDKTSN
ncbi:MAG: undecaprenyl/decaprenyl-phosphate alpha-N-acetylglucosaminyl 1-phosphate transferase [Sedimentisphaerales bacterium]|nr:undecaprenyl/decaprenyl-phosphate alpha-N-acetylglucosaminyl 1-phosphate transferase [Sedimentisphaerales bacterium]